jgi:hypothetical protein
VTNKHQKADQKKWQPWAVISDFGGNVAVFDREYVIAHLSAPFVLASSNTTVILERMVRVGRVSWEKRMRQ